MILDSDLVESGIISDSWIESGIISDSNELLPGYIVLKYLSRTIADSAIKKDTQKKADGEAKFSIANTQHSSHQLMSDI